MQGFPRYKERLHYICAGEDLDVDVDHVLRDSHRAIEPRLSSFWW